MIQLFVEKQAIDINESFSTLLTMSIDDIKDFGAKNTTFSKTIILPGTKNNNKIFGNIFNINARNDYNSAQSNISNNFNPAIAASAIIFADNMQVFKGVFRILEVIVEDGFIEYECAVFGELGGFISALGNKKIDELNFSAYNTAWNYANITASWNTIAGSGLLFPLIDYGATSSNLKNDFDYETFRPAIYVREILEKIISGSGYTSDFPFVSSALMNRMIIPNNQKEIYNTSTSTAFSASATAATFTSIQFARYTISTLGLFTASLNNDVFTYTGATPLNTNISCSYNGQINSLTPSPGTITFTLKQNSTIISTQSIFVASVPRPFGVTLSVNNITFNTSDTLKLEISSNVIQIQQYGGALTVTATAPTQVRVNYGDTLNINDCIPKGVFQKEFFSSICKMFNLYVFEDYETDKKLKVLPFITFYENALSVDYSLKVDRSKPMRIKPMSELNSRYYNFKFKTDNDYFSENYRKKYNEGYGDFIYDTEFEFAKETTSIELIFSNTILTKFTGADKIFPSIYKLSNSNNSEDRMDSVIRIMQAKKISGVTAYNIKNGATTVGSPTAYGYCGHLDDPITPTSDLCFSPPKELDFLITNYTSNNLFNIYWSSYMAEITDKDSRMLTCTMKLAYKDIYKLDFSKLIWIDGVLYRLNKINDFNATNEDVCTVELLKIINRIY